MANSRVKKQSLKRPTRSRHLPSTKKLSAYTPTSRVFQKNKNQNTSHQAIVEGISMWPVLLPGYKVFYRPIDPNQIQLGDIAIIHGEDRSGKPLLKVHRIIGRAGPLFLEAGDNTFVAFLIRADQIEGVVTRIKTKTGKEVRFKKITVEDLSARFRFWVFAAHSFMLAHEIKDRLLKGRKSKILWNASVLYRKGFETLGLKVPTLLPGKIAS